MHEQDSQTAWQWFVERYRPFVRGILGRMLGPPSRATAAEEEFWGYVWMSGALRKADRNRRFRAFLSGIVKNFARSYARKGCMPIASEDALSAVPAAGDEETEWRLWVDNVIHNAAAALLAESHAAGLALASFYGLPGGVAPGHPKSAHDVAVALGNTVQGIYMLLFRGRKRLRELIENELREGCSDDEAFRQEVQSLLGVAATRLPGLLADS